MSDTADAFTINQRHWNDLAALHASRRSDIYDFDRLVAGADSLSPIEAAEIGEVAGLSLLHLQCHLGLDCVSFARRGAQVTALDFSSQAIAAARRLAADAGVPVTYVEGNVYDTRQLISGQFDLVYASWGVFCWVPDVVHWLHVAASMLNPGGRLYVVDSHPMLGMLDEAPGPDGQPRLVVTESWRTPIERPIEYDAPLSYTGDPRPITHAASREWTHSLSAYLTGLHEAGLELMFFHEHEQIPWQAFPNMEIGPATGLWQLAPELPRVPLAFSLMATMPASDSP